MAGLAGSCGGATNKPITGSESHFLETCEESCGQGLQCICGVCTRVCDDASKCTPLADGAACVELADVGPTGCTDVSPAQGVCDRACSNDGQCSGLGDGFVCKAGVCREPDGPTPGDPTPTPEDPESTCALPLETGECRASMPRFGFDPVLGTCRPFTYGGCGGNANNFESFAECVTTCTTFPQEAFECVSNSQCARLDAAPCRCDPSEKNDFFSLNVMYQQAYNELRAERPVCAPCEPTGTAETTSVNFGAHCNAGRCEIFDVRESQYSECTPEVGCTLRGGVSCCQECEAGVVALSADADVYSDLQCNELPITCVACGPTIDEDTRAECIEGRCQVLTGSD